MKKLIYGMIAAMLLAVCFAACATAETKAELKNDLEYVKGKLIIEWDVEGEEADKYVVYVEAIRSGTAKQKLIRIGATTKHSIATSDCVPGMEYAINLCDGDGNLLNRKAYRMDPVAPFNDGRLQSSSITVRIEPQKKAAGEEAATISELRADDIIAGLQNGNASYGIKYQMTMPQLSKARSYFVTLLFKAPNGFQLVEIATDVTFSKASNGPQTQWWDLAGEYCFREMYKANGDIAKGQYEIVLLWDGKWVNTEHFTVN